MEKITRIIYFFLNILLNSKNTKGIKANKETKIQSLNDKVNTLNILAIGGIEIIEI